MQWDIKKYFVACVMRGHVECITYGPFITETMPEVPSGPLQSSVSETVVNTPNISPV